MRILFLGPKNGTCAQKARALERLGHEVAHFDVDALRPAGRIRRRFHYETGGLFAANYVARRLLQSISNVDYDLGWVDGGRYVGPTLVRELRKRAPVLCYNHDDPYGRRDRFSWSLFRRTIPEYDLVCVARKPNVEEAKLLGAKKVVLTHFTADEVAHRARELSLEERAKWGSDVIFVGTEMEDRAAFMNQLVVAGVPLSIYGARWPRTKEWPTLKSAYRGSHLESSEAYSAAIIGSKVALGLLSKGNRDLHTTRSIEIPAMGALLCAKRTSDHLEMYVEGEEAVFWDTAQECAEVCCKLMADEKLRLRIAAQGHERCMRNGDFNEPLCRRLIAEVGLSGGEAR